MKLYLDNRVHPIYLAWQNMRRRCDDPTNKSYKDYGARGITYCERWKHFDNFQRDMLPSWKEGLSFDREDNSKGYYPENCRWVTGTTSRRNRDYVKVTMDIAQEVRALYATGRYTQGDLGKQFGVSRQTIGYIVTGRSWL